MVRYPIHWETHWIEGSESEVHGHAFPMSSPASRLASAAKIAAAARRAGLQPQSLPRSQACSPGCSSERRGRELQIHSLQSSESPNGLGNEPSEASPANLRRLVCARRPMAFVCRKGQNLRRTTGRPDMEAQSVLSWLAHHRRHWLW